MCCAVDATDVFAVKRMDLLLLRATGCHPADHNGQGTATCTSELRHALSTTGERGW